MKKELIGLVLAAVAINGHASFKQKVTLCLDASGNQTNHAFVGHFGSSDLFDHGTDTPIVGSARSCVSHNYKKGPKNISINAKVINGDKVLLIPGDSCSYMYTYKNDPARLASDYQATTGTEETWSLSFVQSPPVGEFKDVFVMNCEHVAQ